MNRLFGVLAVALTAVAWAQADQKVSLRSPVQPPSIAAPRSTEIAVYLEKEGEPVPAQKARDVSVRVDFFADEAADRPVGPFVILQPMPGTSIYRATLPAIDEGGVKSARITLIRAGTGPHDQPLPSIFPMTENRLKAEIELPGGV